MVYVLKLIFLYFQPYAVEHTDELKATDTSENTQSDFTGFINLSCAEQSNRCDRSIAVSDRNDVTRELDVRRFTWIVGVWHGGAQCVSLHGKRGRRGDSF